MLTHDSTDIAQFFGGSTNVTAVQASAVLVALSSAGSMLSVAYTAVRGRIHYFAIREKLYSRFSISETIDRLDQHRATVESLAPYRVVPQDSLIIASIGLPILVSCIDTMSTPLLTA